MSVCEENLGALGTKLEQCMNSLPLGNSALIEDPGLLEHQVGEYGSKLRTANGLMEQDRR